MSHALLPMRLLLHTLLLHAKPHHLSSGLALGILLGLIPKGNLIAIVMVVLLAVIPANLAVATLSLLLASLVSPICFPMFDQIGGRLLSVSFLAPVWSRMATTPLIPWANFQNSVVMGSLCAGAILSWPVYALSYRVFKKYAGQTAIFIERLQTAGWLLNSPGKLLALQKCEVIPLASNSKMLNPSVEKRCA